MPRLAPLYYNPEEPMPPQTADWTCAACSLAWANRALAIDHATDEWSAVEYIGTPQNINAEYGLMDGSGGRLADCLIEQGAPAYCCWPSWDQVLFLAAQGPLLIGGQHWYHWVGVRGTDGQALWLANSAPGWHGVYEFIDEKLWNVEGPFAAVVITTYTQFPPPPQA